MVVVAAALPGYVVVVNSVELPCYRRCILVVFGVFLVGLIVMSVCWWYCFCWLLAVLPSGF